jgi:hypothetical protein
VRTFPLLALLGALLLAAGCGGGSSSPSSIAAGSTQNSTLNNVAPIVVNGGLAGLPNTASVTVTICVPGASICQSIDNVQLDTGTSGLRIMSQELSVLLPAVTAGSGNSLFECFPLEDGNVLWGSVRLADVQIAGETASKIPVQVIGGGNLPGRCAPVFGGQVQDDVFLFGANGLLGVGVAVQDCGALCTSNATNPGLYYVCDSTAGCSSNTPPATLANDTPQVSNPVASFSTDNNGVIIELPALSPRWASSVSGSLLFGIGTQPNNSLGSAQFASVDSIGNVNTVIDGVQKKGLVRSAARANVFQDSALAGVPETDGFYCPAASQLFLAEIQGKNGVPLTISFNVDNDCALLPSSGNFAFSGLAGPPPQPDPTWFTWGLPFFFGRDVYVAIDGQPTPAGQGPYIAF